MQTKNLLLLFFSGSILLMTGALLFQYIAGFIPCPMCIWQRTPHFIVILLTPLTLLLAARDAKILPWIVLVASLAYFTTSLLGGYHAGVEYQWWPGPDSCTGSAMDTSSVEALLQQLDATPLVMCDEIPWSLFGISMAGYNFLFSGGFALFGFWIFLRLRRVAS